MHCNTIGSRNAMRWSSRQNREACLRKINAQINNHHRLSERSQNLSNQKNPRQGLMSLRGNRLSGATGIRTAKHAFARSTLRSILFTDYQKGLKIYQTKKNPRQGLISLRGNRLSGATGIRTAKHAFARSTLRSILITDYQKGLKIYQAKKNPRQGLMSMRGNRLSGATGIRTPDLRAASATL